jgi:hypothetical protein
MKPVLESTRPKDPRSYAVGPFTVAAGAKATFATKLDDEFEPVRIGTPSRNFDIRIEIDREFSGQIEIAVENLLDEQNEFSAVVVGAWREPGGLFVPGRSKPAVVPLPQRSEP